METSKKFLKEIIDWKKVKTGTFFSAKISRKKCVGKIWIDKDNNNNVFFCNNTIGENCLTHKQKFGLKYAVLLESNYLHEPHEFDIKDIVLSDEKPEGFEIPELIKWNKVKPGTYFECEIYGRSVKGLIQKNDDCIYLCNNETGGYSEEEYGFDFFGFTHSYYYDEDDELDVENLKLFTSIPKGFKLPEKKEKKFTLPKYAGYKPVIKKGKVTFGCSTISNENIRLLVEHLID